MPVFSPETKKGNMFKLIVILCTLAVDSVSAAPFSADNIGSTVVAQPVCKDAFPPRKCDTSCFKDCCAKGGGADCIVLTCGCADVTSESCYCPEIALQSVSAGLSAGHNYTRYSSLSDDTPSPCNIKMPGLFCASCCRHRNVTSMCTYCCGCGGSTPTPPTPPTPTPPVPPTPPPPAPPTPPSPSGCPGGTLSACIGLCPSNPAVAYKACVNACVARCT